MGVEDVDPVEDWLCAAKSALMVSGEICEPPPPVPALEPVEAEELEKKSNELAWLTPVVSCGRRLRGCQRLRGIDRRRSGTKSKQHGITPTTPRNAADRSRWFLSKRHASAKNPIKQRFLVSDPFRHDRQ
jgi:hypothetical protein